MKILQIDRFKTETPQIVQITTKLVVIIMEILQLVRITMETPTNVKFTMEINAIVRITPETLRNCKNVTTETN